MRVFKSVLLALLALVCVGGGGLFFFGLYKNSQPPSFSAQRFLRLCRPQIEAEVKALRAQREVALAHAKAVYLYTDSPTPEGKAEKKMNMDDAQAALDELRANGVYSKATYFTAHANEIGRREVPADLTHDMAELWKFTDDERQPLDAAQAHVQLCMMNAKLSELEEKTVGDEHAGVPPQLVNLPLKQNETRVAFHNGCGAVMPSSASKSAMDDKLWLGACNFGLAHGKGLVQLKDKFTPATYFYGFDITTGQPGGDGAPGAVAEIAARFKPLEAERLRIAKAIADVGSHAQGKGH
jgi:hypothetical protein